MAVIPFTTAQFLEVFSAYNHAVFPFQLILFVLAIIALILAITKSEKSDRIIFAILCFFWLWTGLVYQFLFFTSINPFGYLFGALFILEAILLLYFGVMQEKIGFSFTMDSYSVIGLVFIIYSLIIYPILGSVAGHPYPYLPTFGVPCPTTIFTFGMFLLADRKFPWYLLVIPLIWSFIGVTAAPLFGIVEDYGLVVAGVLGTVLILMKNRKGFAS